MNWKILIGGGSLVIGSIALVATIATGTIYQSQLTSPLSEQSRFNFFVRTQKKIVTPKKVLGFLPYWNLDEFTQQPELTDLAYFALEIDADGSIISKVDGATEPGFRTFTSSAFQNLVSDLESQPNPPQLTIVFSQFNTKSMTTFLASPTAQTTFFTAFDSLMEAYPIQGVNIDFEPTGKISQKNRDDFTQFMARLAAHKQKQHPNLTISVDVYASAVARPLLWDVPALTNHLDYIVIMAYDFHRKSSPAAGPVAPIYGASEYWEHDISLYLRDFLKVVPREKILLGVPFYGYGWQTTSTAPQAPTYPETGRTASYLRVKELISDTKNLGLQTWWNEAALSPYITYIENGKNFTIYYDDARSLSYKIELINQLNLGGIAIWALGYEGADRDLWDTLKNF